MKFRIPALLAVCASLIITGCAPMAQKGPAGAFTDDLFHDTAFKPPSETVGTADLFTLSPEMKSYLDDPAFRSSVRSSGATLALMDALYKKSGLKIDYEANLTRPAAETFKARTGNCLSLVIMTAAFAKALNIDVVYQNVMVDEQWSRTSSLYIGNTHVNLSLANPGDASSRFDAFGSRYVIDFIPSDAAAKQRAYPINYRMVEAMYLNNRAGEALAEGRVDDAYWWAKASVARDPGFMMAYNTLGVTYQKQGKLAQAEHVYKRALVRVPEDTVVMHNLVQVLKAVGKDQESAALAAQLASIEPFPPFYFFEKGLLAMNDGKVEEAKTFFARELRRSPYNHEFHFWLAMAHLRLGDARAAKSELAAAINSSTTADATQRYSAKLDYLRSLSAKTGTMIR